MKKQNLKIGDSLLCKKNLSNSNMIYFLKGNEYEVCDIKIDWDDETDYAYFILDDNKNDVLFMIQEDIDALFLNKMEMRKMKLKKLNNDKPEY